MGKFSTTLLSKVTELLHWSLVSWGEGSLSGVEISVGSRPKALSRATDMVSSSSVSLSVLLLLDKLELAQLKVSKSSFVLVSRSPDGGEGGITTGEDIVVFLSEADEWSHTLEVDGWLSKVKVLSMRYWAHRLDFHFLVGDGTGDGVVGCLKKPQS